MHILAAGIASLLLGSFSYFTVLVVSYLFFPRLTIILLSLFIGTLFWASLMIATAAFGAIIINTHVPFMTALAITILPTLLFTTILTVNLNK